jgi:hypothetical protein
VNPLLSLPNLPEEGAGNIETYVSSINSQMVVNKPRAKPYRRPFDPEAKKDRDLLYPSVLLALLAESHEVSLSSVLSVENEGVKCKWRLLRLILPVHVEQTPIPKDDDTFIGGNGLFLNPEQDRRLWECMCLVNDSLMSGSDDGLSCKRVYMNLSKQNAHKRILCGLLMLTLALITPSSTSSAVTGLRGQKSMINVPEKSLEDVYATVYAIFRQYDKAALLLPSYSTIEDLILP